MLNAEDAGWFLLAIGSAIAFGTSGFLMKFGTRKAGSNGDALLLGLYTTGSLCFVGFGALRGSVDIGPLIVLVGVLLGAGSVFGNIFFVKAMRVGPASLSAPLVNANVVLTVFMSILFFEESLGLTEAIGVVLILIAMVILPIDPNESISITNRSWYPLVTIATLLFFVRNGGLKITEEANFDSTSLLIFGYLFGVVWFGFQLRTIVSDLPRMREFQTGLIGGFCSFGGLQMYALALETGPASIISPIFASAGLVVALWSFTILKERLSPLQLGALAVIMSGIILLRI